MVFKIKDIDYVFIIFVMEYFLVGLVGLLFVVIFLVAMFLIVFELNVLVMIMVVDFYWCSFVKDKSDWYYLNVFKVFMVVWGGIVLVFVVIVNLFENFI